MITVGAAITYTFSILMVCGCNVLLMPDSNEISVLLVSWLKKSVKIRNNSRKLDVLIYEKCYFPSQDQVWVLNIFPTHPVVTSNGKKMHKKQKGHLWLHHDISSIHAESKLLCSPGTLTSTSSRWLWEALAKSCKTSIVASNKILGPLTIYSER